jgi:hypothetical protein
MSSKLIRGLAVAIALAAAGSAVQAHAANRRVVVINCGCHAQLNTRLFASRSPTDAPVVAPLDSALAGAASEGRVQAGSWASKLSADAMSQLRP